MIILWEQITTLLPVLLISVVIVMILSSIIYCRNQFLHAILTVIGLIASGISSLIIIFDGKVSHNVGQLLCTENIASLCIMLVILSSLASSISVYIWLSNYPTDRRDEFFILLLLSTMGGVLLIMSNHLVMLFLGIELISLPLFGLIGYSFFLKKSIESSFKYIILSGISSAFLLFGIALIYAETKCLSFFEIKEVLLLQKNNTIEEDFVKSMLFIISGTIMILVGFLFKLSLFPFHFWTPEIYQSAPTTVSMYLATGSKIAVISILIRFLSILPIQYHKICYVFLSASACFSMLFGSIMAIQQYNIKRILAYSSITQSGYILVAIISSYIDNLVNQEVIGIYLISYLFANIGVFCIINLISSFKIEKNLDSLCCYRGLFWSNPILSVMFIIMILSLAGIPLTLGFIGKFYLFLISVSKQLWVTTSIIAISSVISIFYYLKLIINLFLSPKIDKNNLNYYFK